MSPDASDTLRPLLTVTALNRQVRETLQRSFPLLNVAGEISNLTRAASGHIYFSLKDENAQVRCVMFRNRAQLIPWRLENGQQVEAQAVVTLFEARGDFQLNIEGLRRAGLGRLYEAFARLRERLEAEGLFSASRKQEVPRFPRGIGIVSSPQAAALQDILIALHRRAPHVPLILYPTPVQGEEAAGKISHAIETAGQRAAEDGVDVLIVARGGGSIEDLWAFNEECVARAIAACPLPVISGIGHETDVTIADFAADHRAATPTAAAEIASTGWFEAADEIRSIAAHLQRLLKHQIEARMQRLDLLTHRLLHPGQRLKQQLEHVRHLRVRLNAAMRHQLHKHFEHLSQTHRLFLQARPELAPHHRHVERLGERLKQQGNQPVMQYRAHLAKLEALLSSLGPQATLARGYSIIRDPHGKLVRSVQQLECGNPFTVLLSDGQVHAHVDQTPSVHSPHEP